MDLRSAHAKLDWAQAHYNRLATEVRVALRLNPYAIRAERDEDASRYVFWIENVQKPPTHWGLLLGDCVHNARTALDQLTYALACQEQGVTALREELARTVAFPIFHEPGKFFGTTKQPGKGVRSTKLLSAAAQTRIEELQPFNAHNTDVWGDRTGPDIPIPGSYIPRCLLFLSELDNRDKHRLTEWVWYSTSPRNPSEILGQEVRYGAITGVLETDTELGSWEFDTLPAELPSHLEVNRYFALEPCLSDVETTPEIGGFPIFTFNLMAELKNALVAATQVLVLFEDAVTHGADPRPVTDLPWMPGPWAQE